MISEVEDEIMEMRAVIVRTGGYQLQKLEAEKNTYLSDIRELKDQLGAATAEISNRL